MTDMVNASKKRADDRDEPSLGQQFLAALAGTRPRPPLPAADQPPRVQHHASYPKHRKQKPGDQCAPAQFD